MVTCTRALMGVARCIYGNCFVGKYFVVCFSTTKNLPPELHAYYNKFYYNYTPSKNCSSNEKGLIIDARAICK